MSGLRKHPLYRKWVNIKTRCFNTSYPEYHYYGGRGITVCPEWRNDFKAFYDYVITLDNYGKEGYSLDRFPNNDGDYEPGNLRWATNHQQGVNRRRRLDNKSGYIGVCYHKRDGKYEASISVNGKQIHIASHKTKKEVVEARNNYITSNGLTEYPLQEWKG